MKEKDNNEEIIGRRSEQIQTIIDRMPTKFGNYAAIVVAVLVLVIFTLSFVIKYPDTIDGSISVTAQNAPVRLVGAANSRLHLLSETNQNVDKNQVIGYLENAADYNHVIQLEKLVRQTIEESNYPSIILPDHLTLGELSSAYGNFVLNYKQYSRFVNSNIYTPLIKNLRDQIASDSLMLRNIDKEILIKKKILDIASDQNIKDSIMHQNKAISEVEYNRRNSAYLSQTASFQNMLTSVSNITSRITNTYGELSRAEIERQESNNKYYSSLHASRSELLNMIEQWKQRYLFVSPINGKLEFLGFWRENTFIQSGQEVFSILPDQNEVFGEVMIPAVGAGKVEVGQNVNVKLHDFPFDEYGVIMGKVSSISTLSNKVKTPQGEMPCYLVRVAFPDGLTTNYGQTLAANFETSGTAEIVIKPKRLIHRLFDNLKSFTNK